MRWSGRHTLAVAAALVLATNAVVLAGVAYNRSGTPDSELRLSERELRPQGSWAENTGLALDLVWRVRRNLDETQSLVSVIGGPWTIADWLDSAKLTGLGFDLPQPSAAGAERRYARIQPREVFLVLEFDGEAYKAALDAVRERARLRAAEASAQPANKKLKAQADSLKKRLDFEEHAASRLFVVDAGLNRKALRARYPDRTRFAIVYGRVCPRLRPRGSQMEVAGYVQALSNDSVNVPLPMRQVFEGARASASYGPARREKGLAFTATVAFGKRLEPWLVNARRDR